MNVTILDTLDHPQLFGPHFRGDTWRPWRCFLKALFALPMDDAELALFRHHTERQPGPAAPFREAALVVGRRGGKSRVLAVIAVFLACFRDYAPFLALGEVATIAVIASDRRQARSIFRFISGSAACGPGACGADRGRNGGGDCPDEPCRDRDPHLSVSRHARLHLRCGAADETAFWRDETSANPDVEIFRALRPGLANHPRRDAAEREQPIPQRPACSTRPSPGTSARMMRACWSGAARRWR